MCVCVCVCACVCVCVCVCSELSISGMHRSLAKQDACIANMNLEILPVNVAPLSRISVTNLQTSV